MDEEFIEKHQEFFFTLHRGSEGGLRFVLDHSECFKVPPIL